MKYLSVVLVACVLLVILTATAVLATVDYPIPIQRGNGLANVFAKLNSGQSVKISYLGGSVTQMTGYRDNITAWFNSQYPGKITEVNAGWPGTGSLIGAMRMNRDILAGNPDLVFIEFAVNDLPEDTVAFIQNNSEGMVRQAWTTNSMTDVCFLEGIAYYNEAAYLSGVYPNSVQAHYNVCDQYGIPSVNMGWALYEHVLAGTPWTDLAPDRVHPNATGMAIYSDAVISYLSGEKTRGGSSTAHSLASVISSFPVTGSTIGDMASITPMPSGWTALYNQYGVPSLVQSSTVGSTITTTFTGPEAAAKVIVANDSGTGDGLSYSIDGGAYQPANQATNGYTYVWAFPIAKTLSNGSHTVTFKVNAGVARIVNVEAATSSIACTNDAGSGGDAGNTFGTALTITPGSYSGCVNSSDLNDYYKFSVTSGQVITASMTPPSGSDYDLYLYDPSGTQRASSAQYGSATENLSFTADSTGNWVVRVYDYSGSGPYTFSVSTDGMNNNTPTGTNLAPSSTTVNADTFYGAGYEGTKAVDGSTTTKWCTTSVAPPHWLALDLGSSKTVNGYIVRFPGGCGELQSYNAKNFKIQSATSINGPWTDETVVDNTAQANVITKSYITPKPLQFVRFYVTNSGIDNYTRLYEFEVWGVACTMPSITTQPQNSTVCAGTGASFSVTATNATGYQWRKAGSNISSATNSSYSIASTVTGDAGSYDCVVSNACGNVTSTAATLTVNSVPSITTQPQSQTKNVGQSVTFSVTATGATSYQWRKGGSNISAATASSYTIASLVLGDAGNYDVIVTNSCGSVTSSTAVLTVNPVTNGSITGYVKDLTNVAISGATVQTNTGGYTTTTASDGTYTLSNVAPGTYNVTASKSGYNSKTTNGVVVTAGNATTSNFNLQNTTNSNTPGGTNRAGASTTISTDTYYDSTTMGAKAVDGVNTAGSKWVTTGVAPPHWLALDLGSNRVVYGFVVKMPGQAGEQSYYNAKNFSIQSATSMSGPWSDEVVIDNTAQANSVARSYVNARTLRYVRLYITNAGIDNYSRINEFEVWCQ